MDGPASVTRCPTCFRRPDDAHRVLGRCPELDPTPKRATSTPPSRRIGYVPPSRRGRQTRQQYLEAVKLTDEQRKAKSRETSRQYRERRARQQQP